MQINLVWLTEPGAHDIPAWTEGDVFSCQPQVGALAALVREQLPRSTAGMWLFWDGALGAPNPSMVRQTAEKVGDLWHAGLSLGMGGQPGVMDFVNPTWMLNRDPPADIEATSWRLSMRACLARSAVIEQMGFLGEEYQTLDAAGLDWGHRCIRNGVIMRHVPELVVGASESLSMRDKLPYKDELRFIRSRFGEKWVKWVMLRTVLTRYRNPQEVIHAWSSVKKEKSKQDPQPYDGARHKRYQKGRKSASSNHTASIILPTLDRYPYLATMLRQVREQTIPPHEIVIIDQTPLERRPDGFYEEFHDLPIKLIQLDEPGQSSSRNTGLKAAAGDLLLFIDDDDEIPMNLVESHTEHMERTGSLVSCGIANEVGAGPLPGDFTYPRVSDVFPTNNAMIHRSVLVRSGLFDLVYDHGQRADHDLGMRIYLSGTLMLLAPSIAVKHHHAPSGGLRTHKARIVTFASSRARIMSRSLPSKYDLFLYRKYFNNEQLRETICLAVFGTFMINAGGFRRLLKTIYSAILLPATIWSLKIRDQASKEMIDNHVFHPNISKVEE